MPGARRRIQFGIAGLLALTAMLALSLGSMRYGLSRETPISGSVALLLGLLGVGATLGWGVGYLVRGPVGAAWAAWIAAVLVLIAIVDVALFRLLLSP